MAHFGNPKFDCLLKITLLLCPLEDAKLTVMVNSKKRKKESGKFYMYFTTVKKMKS